MRWNTQLESSARGHAQDMARNNYFSHKSLNGNNYAKRIVNAGYPRNSYKAENIAAGRASVDLAMKRLVNSPEHCKNIMNPVYNEFAMVCAYNENSKFEYYWVQNFGKKVFAR